VSVDYTKNPYTPEEPMYHVWICEQQDAEIELYREALVEVINAPHVHEGKTADQLVVIMQEIAFKILSDLPANREFPV